eukprot:TRINITY_DN22847_c0_g1_i1.p1 TRINITY_DN22847_c0_g1~~TRINITY_DN22847_c0_g1_i1.p1  ORF type:complete len:287 (+),score=59.22 TRINITY_DN22847_c0_g1_i1:72-932(+)
MLHRADDLLSQVAHLHRDALLALQTGAGIPFQGLASGGRKLRLSPNLQRKLRHLDWCYGLLRKLSDQSMTRFLEELHMEIDSATAPRADSSRASGELLDPLQALVSSAGSGPSAIVQPPGAAAAACPTDLDDFKDFEEPLAFARGLPAASSVAAAVCLHDPDDFKDLNEPLACARSPLAASSAAAVQSPDPGVLCDGGGSLALVRRPQTPFASNELALASSGASAGRSNSDFDDNASNVSTFSFQDAPLQPGESRSCRSSQALAPRELTRWRRSTLTRPVEPRRAE